jgi:hypothetical protein
MEIKVIGAIVAGTFIALGVGCGGGSQNPPPQTSTTSGAEHHGEHHGGGVDRAGWEKLGEREVDGKMDKDTIHVGRAEGRFTKVMIIVEHAPIELFEMEIEFGDGSKYSPPMRLVFDANTRSRAIDLPGDKRVIKHVTFKYGNLEKGHRATVELLGKP